MIQGMNMIGLYVRDFDASLRFYRDVLGIPLKVDAHGDYHHAEYSFRDPYFHFAIFPAEPAGELAVTHVSFLVDDCRRSFDAAVAAGAPVVREPEVVPYAGGGIVGGVTDPDGNVVEFFQRTS